jgi:hypothetical protein
MVAAGGGAGSAYTGGMCVQCLAGAMTAGVAATGARAWLAAHAGHWLTPGRKRALTAFLIAVGLLGAGLIGPST